MIFITLGSQKFQFNRLLKYIDELIDEGFINEDVFAQIGESDYLPSKYSYIDFLSRDDFREKINLADLVITHGGTGAIVTALKNEKKVIAVPRLAEYGEHVDNHQTEIVTVFEKGAYILGSYDKESLKENLNIIKVKQGKKFVSNRENYIQYLIRSIENL